MRWPKVSKKGFELKGLGPQMLLLHGYTGSPYDLRPLGDFFHKQGFHVVAPLLKGHGEKPESLHEVLAQDWFKQAKTVLKKFSKSRPIIVVGLSMGALMALKLSTEEKIDALVLCSAAFSLGVLAEITLAAAEIGLIDKKTSIKKYSGSDIADPIAKEKTPAYGEMPIGGLLQFALVRKMAKQTLEKVECPIFLAFGQNDQAIDTQSSREMIMSSVKSMIFAKNYEHSKHVITLDYDKERLFLDIKRFLHMQLGI